MPTIEPELRYRDLEQRLAETSITNDPVPSGQSLTITRLGGVDETLQLSSTYLVGRPGRTYRLVPRNYVVNPKFDDDLVGWTQVPSMGSIEVISVYE